MKRIKNLYYRPSIVAVFFYTYSKKSVMQRGKYVYTLPGVYEKALNDGYLLVVDGMFDALHLSSLGFNSAALMGSTITDEIIALLRFVHKVIVIADNDKAGIQLIDRLKQSLHNVVCLFQGDTKDVDEFLKTERRTEIIQVINEMITSTFLIDRSIEIVIN